MHSHNILTAVCIAYGLVTAILAEAVESFIATYGRKLSVLYRMVATFITETMIPKTTTYPISNVCQQRNIFQTLGDGVSPASLPDNILQRQHGKRLPNGMVQKKDGFGIDGMPSALRLGQNGSVNQSSALSVEQRSMRLLEKAGTPKFTAVRPAKWLRIASVKRLSEQQDVWCLTVPDTGCFSLANGVVVHNSHAADAFGLMAVAYEDPSRMNAKLAKINVTPRGHGSWLGA
jgi:hypothetical protein